MKDKKFNTIDLHVIEFIAAQECEKHCVKCNNILNKEDDYSEDMKLFHAYCKSCRSGKKGGN